MPLASQRPLVSVVIPAFDAVSTLSATLASVGAQTVSAIEILIVNDGSTDETRALAAAFVERDARARILDQNNRGVALARNHGLAVAVGRYVAFIDADDLWHPRHLEWLHAALERTQAGLACAGYRRIDAAGVVIGEAAIPAIEGRALVRMLYRNIIGNGSALLVNRAVALAAGGYEPRLRQSGVEGAEDYLFQLRCAARTTLVSVGACTVGYRLLPNSMSSDERRMSRSLRLALRLFRAEHHGPLPRWTLHRWWIARDKIQLASHWLNGGYRCRASATLAMALLLDLIATLAALCDRVGGRSKPHAQPWHGMPFEAVDPFLVPRNLAPNRATRLDSKRWHWAEQADGVFSREKQVSWLDRFRIPTRSSRYS
ncbi:glycosyltransferase family 2 protein [Sphingomonas sp. CROZ-RG-20F-R02-07]|uniref:glycosyltransferase family 2 protein n=1 Tax=Sphingomonas sp. CROZ-RG-20F-R02-07 TaxID=2914832 RepID=UPI001F59989C|nr:glycosyltransferase family 2 protein [Sphingomonas sp. CROZ-RG-20F-R02-07]